MALRYAGDTEIRMTEERPGRFRVTVRDPFARWASTARGPALPRDPAGRAAAYDRLAATVLARATAVWRQGGRVIRAGPLQRGFQAACPVVPRKKGRDCGCSHA